MPLRFALRVDKATIDSHLEHTLFASHKGDARQIIAMFRYKFVRQPDGAWSIVSFLAVDNLNLHISPPFFTRQFANHVAR